MKMSPPGWNLSTVEVEFGIGVIYRDLSFERFHQLHLGPSEAEASGLGWDLEMAPVPLDDVVVADTALVVKATDAVQIFGSGTPSFFRLARGASKATVVVRQEVAQDLIGGAQIVSTGQTQLAGEAILKGAPEAFDAALGLRTVGCDVGDAELLESATELGGFAATGELFFDGPVIVVANEDAVAIPVETERYPEATQQAVEQAEIATRAFGGEEFGDENFAGVQQQHLAFARTQQAALAMHAMSPLMQDEITATRCSSFWLKGNVSLFIG
jgi:hypothetical protein